MKRGRMIIGGAATVLFAALFASACCSVRPAIPDGFTLEERNVTGRFIIYGDTRRAIPGEWLIRATHYDRERQLVADRLLSEKPDFVVHSGDLVGRASSGTEWEKEWDRLTTPLREAGVPIYLAYGNHEYWFDSGEAMTHIAKRFPRLENRHWYAIRYHSLLLIVLDSNFSELASADVARQDDWLDRTLTEASKDERIAHVFLVFHHSPYTNSKVHAPDGRTQEHFVTRARPCPKVKAVFTGHVHNYERFLIDGLNFVVAGGGGAPKTGVNVKQPRFKDEFQGPELRPFQYCVVSSETDAVSVDVMMLKDDGTWIRGDGFVVR